MKKVDRSSLNIKKCLFEGKNDRYFGLVRAESEKSGSIISKYKKNVYLKVKMKTSG